MVQLAQDHIVSRMLKSNSKADNVSDCFVLVFENGRPVVDEDFGQDAFSHSFPLHVSGWKTLNDGLPYGELSVPYWTGMDKAETARRILINEYKTAGLGAPDVLAYPISHAL